MLTQETKRHIDAARQVLVGVVPNPSSQIDQITNALIYKFMDDMDQSAIKAGGEPSFFIEELEPYAWTRLMDSRLGNQERMNLYSEALAKFSEAKQLPELFRGIFKSAFLPYRSPEVLGLFLKEINYFDYSNSEELGNAYEYLLSIMSSQGDAGQFRTPRHIIDFIVAAINPTKDDKILDPACGTSGFLISAYKHILEKHNNKNLDLSENKKKPLTPDQRKVLMNNFEGYDVDPGMVRISQVNMYLHQFRNPKIFNYNTLSQEERWADKFDVILANPPFMSPKGGVSTHNKFSVQSNRSEVLFVDYIVNHLRPKGRAGIIVPEGIIFQSGKAYKQLRKNLLENGLYAVVSLPSGVFQPYSGVKTSILLFDNEYARKNSEILFIKVENDGFDLGAQRRANYKNDLPEALEIINLWKSGKEIKSKLAVYVEKSKIGKNNTYNLSYERYNIMTNQRNAKWSLVRLGNVCKTTSGGTPLKHKEEYYQNGTIPWLRSGEVEQGFIERSKLFITQEGLKNSSAKIFPVNTVLIAMYGATAGKVGLLKFESATNQAICGVLPSDKFIPGFLFQMLKNQKDIMLRLAGGGAQSNISQSIIKDLKIPLPPLEIQEQLVAELEVYQNIISGAKQIVQNWKPKINIDPKWQKVTLEVITDLIQRGKTPIYGNSKVQVIKSGQARGYFEFDFSKKHFVTKDFILDHRQLRERDLLINSTGVGTAGRMTLFKLDGEFVVDGHITIVRIKPNMAKSDYVLYALNSIYGFKGLENMAQGNGGQIELSLSKIKNLEVPLPSIKIQQQIIEKIEYERSSVESAKKLIKIYEQKTKDVLSKLWSE
ncbi:MAG: Type I restriction enzyme EcoKI M protein [Candidatus Anoxychlamydiales bacterium]|nr:Type I restriction enzyme EcoKI M protein [Candidatus Anoxychlamydiales bacterium]